MATLEDAMPYLLEDEGQWAFIPGDKGGMTYCGIARNEHPEWEGWAIIDALNLPVHDAHTCNAILKENAQIQSLVLKFYRSEYWCYDGLQSQDVASKLFNGAVNMEGNGRKGSAITAFQRAICVQIKNTIPIDGCYGPNTEAMANRCDQDGLLEDLARQFVLHYQAILKANPSDEKFRAGWMARAAKLPSDVKATA